MESELGLIVVVALIILVTSLGFTLYTYLHRVEAVNQFATQRRFELVHEDRRLGQFLSEHTGLGNSAVRAENVVVVPIDGSVGTDLLKHTSCGELVWRDGEQTMRRVFLVQPIAAALPATRLSPRTTGVTWPGKADGIEFSESFTVTSANERFASELLDPKLSSFIHERAADIRIDFIPSAIVLTTDRRWDSHVFDGLCDLAEGIEDRIPTAVMRKYGLGTHQDRGDTTVTSARFDWRLRPVPARVAQRAEGSGGL